MVMVHVMALKLSETCSFGIHFISFTCIISKIIPNNFFLLNQTSECSQRTHITRTLILVVRIYRL